MQTTRNHNRRNFVLFILFASLLIQIGRIWGYIEACYDFVKEIQKKRQERAKKYEDLFKKASESLREAYKKEHSPKAVPVTHGKITPEGRRVTNGTYPRSYNFSDYIFETEADAKDVRDFLIQYIDDFGSATVAAFLSSFGAKDQFVDNKWG